MPTAIPVTAATGFDGYPFPMTRKAWWIIAATGAALGFSLWRLGRVRAWRSRQSGRFDPDDQGTGEIAPDGGQSRATTQATVPVQPADLDLGEPGRNTEQRLDEALEETFPGSDPISVHIE